MGHGSEGRFMLVILSGAKDLSLLEQGTRKIGPLWVERLHERVFLAADPTLNLFLPCDRIADVVIGFVVNQGAKLGFFREAFYCAVLMFPDTPLEIVSHTGVEDHAAAVGHHIYKV